MEDLSCKAPGGSRAQGMQESDAQAKDTGVETLRRDAAVASLPVEHRVTQGKNVDHPPGLLDGTEERDVTAPKGKIPIPKKEITNEDVFCGHGLATRHKGNLDSILTHMKEYASASLSGKEDVVEKTLNAIRATNGRFLEKDHNSNSWFEISNEAATKKVQVTFDRYAKAMKKTKDKPFKEVTRGYVRDSDVLFGQGGNKRIRSHKGNIKYRALVSACTRRLGSRSNGDLAKEVMDTIHADRGRFLIKDGRSRTWVEASEKKAKQNIKEALRRRASKSCENHGNTVERTCDASNIESSGRKRKSDPDRSGERHMPPIATTLPAITESGSTDTSPRAQIGVLDRVAAGREAQRSYVAGDSCRENTLGAALIDEDSCNGSGSEKSGMKSKSVAPERVQKRRCVARNAVESKESRETHNNTSEHSSRKKLGVKRKTSTSNKVAPAKKPQLGDTFLQVPIMNTSNLIYPFVDDEPSSHENLGSKRKAAEPSSHEEIVIEIGSLVPTAPRAVSSKKRVSTVAGRSTATSVSPTPTKKNPPATSISLTSTKETAAHKDGPFEWSAIYWI